MLVVSTYKSASCTVPYNGDVRVCMCVHVGLLACWMSVCVKIVCVSECFFC